MSLLNGSENAGQSSTTPPADNPNPNTNAGGTETKWYDSLPDDLKSNDTIKHFQDVPALVKSYIHAQSMIGKKGVVVPTDKDADEAWEGFYKAIGRPELDKYELKSPEGFDAEELKAFKEEMYQHGILPRQAQKMLEKRHQAKLEHQKNMNEEIARYTQEGIENLKTEWGEGFNRHVNLAKNALQEVGGEEMQKYIMELGLDNDAKFVKMFAKIGKLLGEDKLRGEGGGQFGLTPEEISREHDKLSTQLVSTPTSDPNYKTLAAQVEKLAKMRWGG